MESINVSFLLNQSVIRAVPSLNVKMRILRLIRDKKRMGLSGFNKRMERLANSFGFGNPRFGFFISFLMVVIVFEIAMYSFTLYKEVTREEQAIIIGNQRLTKYQSDLFSLQSTVKEQEEILSILRSPSAQSFRIEASTSEGRSNSKIVWDADRTPAILFTDRLPELKNNEIYQLWIFTRGQNPARAGIVQKSPGQNDLYIIRQCRIPQGSGGATVLVSVEKNGGATKSGSPQVILGNLK